jgi:hypothetical protein
MAYVGVDPTPAAPPPSPASPERANDIVAPPPRIIRTWINVPHGPSTCQLTNGESAGLLPSTEGEGHAHQAKASRGIRGKRWLSQRNDLIAYINLLFHIVIVPKAFSFNLK